MKPSTFPQATALLHRPVSMTDKECASLWVHKTDGAFVSCWRPTWRERLAILFGCPLWLWVIGYSHPPVALEVHNPFPEDKPCSPSSSQ